MSTLLSDQMLDDALPRLHGWCADAGSLRREFSVPAGARGRVTAEVDALAARTHHPIRVTAAAGGVTIRLTSDDVGGVSEVDVALASRINDLVAELGPPSSRRTGGNGAVPPPRVTADAATADGDEREWWDGVDTLEPVIGVPAATSAVMPAPLPDTAPEEPEPGVEPEQELGAGHGLGWVVHHPGED